MSWVGILVIVGVVYLLSNFVVRRFGLFSSAVDGEALRQLIAQEDGSMCLVDVRTPDEYEHGHIPTAVNISHDRIGTDPPKVSKDSLVVLYCQSGSRSVVARSILSRQGFTNIVNFGPIRRWKLEVVEGPHPGAVPSSPGPNS